MQAPALYHGDEIEVYCEDAEWTAKKVLRILNREGYLEWQGLLFILEFKVDSPDAPGVAGVFIDGAEEPALEIPVSATEYKLFDSGVNAGGMGIGAHVIEVKLKSEGGKIYNRLFEVRTVPPRPVGSVVKTS